MAIPDYQTLMLPLLQLIAQRRELRTAEAIANLAEQHTLTADERAQMLPSGAATTFGSRVGWAKTYLKQAGLIEQPSRGVMRLTARGADVLARNLTRLDNELLATFEDFQAFRRRSKVEREPDTFDSSVEPQESPVSSSASPQERVDDAVKEINATLADDIIAAIKAASPSFFEELVVKLLLRMGYGGSRQEAGRAVGRSGDGGIDGIINEDRLGLDAVYIQAKRWEGSVGRPEIMKFVGALAGQRANKGVFITTSSFTNEAMAYALQSQYRVVLINGERLAQLMMETDLGVSTIATYHVKRLDGDFFGEE